MTADKLIERIEAVEVPTACSMRFREVEALANEYERIKLAFMALSA